MPKRKSPDDGHDETGNIRKKGKGIPTVGLPERRKKDKEWLKGRLCPIKKENAWFIEPFAELPNGYDKSKDVFMYPKYISEYILPVKEGDKLEFMLGDRNKTRPMAYKVRIFQYSRRTLEELTEYMQKLIKNLDTKNEVLVKVLPCTAMWSFLGSPKFKTATGLYFVHETIECNWSRYRK